MARNDESSGVGGRLSARVADQVSRSMADTARRLAPHKKAVAMSIMDELFRIMDDEARKALGPWLDRIANDPDLPRELKPLMKAVSDPHGQWQMLIAGSTTGAVMGGGLMSLITNEMNPVILPMIALNPNNTLAPAVAASAEARGLSPAGAGEDEAALGGINKRRYTSLLEMARTWPSASETATLLNRDNISWDTALAWMRLNGYRDDVSQDVLKLRRELLTPDRLAQLVTFGVLPESEASPMAEMSGMGPDDFHRLVLGNGEPPSNTELLLAWRRGIIKESDVDRGITQGPVRNEWIPVIKSMQWEPLSVGEAADAVNQGHLTLDEARKVARENGIRDADFDVIIRNAGIPPGPQTVLEWVNRGEITEDTALSMLYESRIKNEWVPTYLKTRHEVMPPDTVRLLYSRGALSKAEALHRLQQRGLSPEDAAIYVLGASREKTAAQRDLTVAQILSLVESGAITADAGAAMIEKLGYDKDETHWMMLIPEMRKLQTLQNAALGRIQRSYLMGIVTNGDASGAMDRLGIASDQRDMMLQLWDEERATPTKGLTAAEVGSAVVRGYLTEEQGVDRLVGQGYGVEDARIRLALSMPKPKAPKGA